MDRRAFICSLAGGLLAAPLATEAQSTPTVRRIGVVGGTNPESVEARKEGLRRLGWVEGQNIVVEHVPVGDGSDARDLVRRNVEMIMASSTPAIAAAKAATTTIPIVMVSADDPIGQGYIASLARPGGNITGGTSVVPETQTGGSKVFDLLAACLPGLSRLAVLVDPTFPSYRTFWLRVEAAARSRGMAVQAVLGYLRSGQAARDLHRHPGPEARQAGPPAEARRVGGRSPRAQAVHDAPTPAAPVWFSLGRSRVGLQGA